MNSLIFLMDTNEYFLFGIDIKFVVPLWYDLLKRWILIVS